MKLLSFIYYITIQKCKHFLYILKIIISYNIKYIKRNNNESSILLK